jgi:hypothetical protein
VSYGIALAKQRMASPSRTMRIVTPIDREQLRAVELLTTLRQWQRADREAPTGSRVNSPRLPL